MVANLQLLIVVGSLSSASAFPIATERDGYSDCPSQRDMYFRRVKPVACPKVEWTCGERYSKDDMHYCCNRYREDEEQHGGCASQTPNSINLSSATTSAKPNEQRAGNTDVGHTDFMGKMNTPEYYYIIREITRINNLDNTTMAGTVNISSEDSSRIIIVIVIVIVIVIAIIIIVFVPKMTRKRRKANERETQGNEMSSRGGHPVDEVLLPANAAEQQFTCDLAEDIGKILPTESCADNKPKKSKRK